MKCLFCDFVNNKNKNFYKVWENEKNLAFLDINPVNKGHVLLVPKKHYSDVLDIEDDLYLKLFSSAKILAMKMKKKINAPRVGFVIEGFGVDHVHIHLVPVYNGGELNPDRAYRATEMELKEIQKLLSDIFND